MIALVRAAALTSYAEVARGAGLDPYEMLKRVGISQSALVEKDMRIPVPAVHRLLEQSAALSGVENFGLRMAQTRRLSILGPLGLAVRDAPDLHTLLSTVIDYMQLHNESMSMHMERAEPYTTLRAALRLPKRSGTRQAMELSVGSLQRILKIYLGEDWSPVRVSFMHQSPADPALHRQVFGAALEFGGEFDGIICKSADLDKPIATADPVMATYGRRQLELGLACGGNPIVHEVRHLILILLPSGRCSIDQVARHLCKDRRTIHRQLAQSSQTFSRLLQDTRAELSDTYLKNPLRPLADIAAKLGFSGPSAYARWHQQVFAETARQRRARLSDADAERIARAMQAG